MTPKDGRFEFAFEPPEPYDFTLTIRRGAGVATMCGRWPAPEPGALVELGDVLVRHGTLLRGRVVDENGSPQSGVRIKLTRVERERNSLELGYPAIQSALSLGYPEIQNSQHDGTFAFRQLLAAGSYRVEVSLQNWLLVEPRTIDIVDGDGVRSVDIHVQSFPDGDAIAGVVTDDRGEPVSGAEVPHAPMTSGGQLVVRTAADGAFRIRRSEQEPREARGVAVRVMPGIRITSDDPTRYEWGANGLSIVLRKGRTVTIAVRDGDLGKPVKRYGVRCFPAPRSGVRTAEASRLRNRGEHPDGVLELDGVCSGRQILIVEPEGAEWLTVTVELEGPVQSPPPRHVLSTRLVWICDLHEEKPERPDDGWDDPRTPEFNLHPFGADHRATISVDDPGVFEVRAYLEPDGSRGGLATLDQDGGSASVRVTENGPASIRIKVSAEAMRKAIEELKKE